MIESGFKGRERMSATPDIINAPNYWLKGLSNKEVYTRRYERPTVNNFMDSCRVII